MLSNHARGPFITQYIQRSKDIVNRNYINTTQYKQRTYCPLRVKRLLLITWQINNIHWEIIQNNECWRKVFPQPLLLSLYSPLIVELSSPHVHLKRIHLKLPLEMISRLMVVYSTASSLSFHRISCSQLWRCSATSSCVTRPWPRPGAPWPSPAGWWLWWSASRSSPPPPGSGTGRTLSGQLQVNVARIIM